MWRRWAVVALATALGACALFTDFGGLSNPPDPVDAAGAGGDAAFGDAPLSGGGDAGGCRGTKGPKPVRVGSYCIDSTEVTTGQYDEFVAARGADTSGQIPDCAGNTSYARVLSRDAEFPVANVDWCDALAYCTWAGKRLCGKVGGGSVSPDLVSNAFADEWHRACTAEGKSDYAYGDTFDMSACVVGDTGRNGPLPADGKRCEGGFPGVFDLSGNLWEWEDSCPQAGTCTMRGGSYHPEHDGACSMIFYGARIGPSVGDVGIRCCSDLQ